MADSQLELLDAAQPGRDICEDLLVHCAASFRLLHLERAPHHDRSGHLAFDCLWTLNESIDITAPALYLLPRGHVGRGVFAVKEHAPATHTNDLMMLVVDQDRAIESLVDFEMAVRRRAAALLRAGHNSDALEVPASSSLPAEEVDFTTLDASEHDVGEPPSWTYEALGLPDEPGGIGPDFEDLDA